MTTKKAHAVLAVATSDTDISVQTTHAISNKKRRCSGPDCQSPRTTKSQAMAQEMTASQDEDNQGKKENQKKARAMINIKENTRTLDRVTLTKEELIEILARRCSGPDAIIVVNHVATLKADHSKVVSKLRQDLARARRENARLMAEIKGEHPTSKTLRNGTRRMQTPGEPASQAESINQEEVIAIPGSDAGPTEDEINMYARAAKKPLKPGTKSVKQTEGQAPRPPDLGGKEFPPLRPSLKELVQRTETKKPTGETRARITADVNKSSPHTSITMEFNPAKEGIRVKRLRQTGPNTLFVEADTPEDLDKLISAKGLSDHGYKIEKLSNKRPRIVVYDIPTVLTKKELIQEIYDRNEQLKSKFTKDEFISKARVLFCWTRTRSQYTTHWVLEVAPDVRARIKEDGNRLYTGWPANRVADYLDAVRCYKCQLYGHITKHCKSHQDTCGHCGQMGHAFKNCVSKNNGLSICVPCRKAGRPNNHCVKDRDCPARNLAIREAIRKTNYAS